MICSTCGREIDGNLSFCTYCGASVAKPQANNFDATVMADPQVLPNAEPSVPAFNNAVPAQAPVSAGDAAQESALVEFEGNVKTPFILSIVSLALSFYGIGIIFFFILKGKFSDLEKVALNFTDATLNARYQSALKKVNLAKLFSKISLFVGIASVAIYVLSFFFGIFLGILSSL